MSARAWSAAPCSRADQTGSVPPWPAMARRIGIGRHTAFALTGLAMAGHGGTDPVWSARLHGAADRALADMGHALEPLEEQLADRDRQRLRAAMGTDAFETEYAAGRTLTPEQTLALALSDLPARTDLPA